MTTVPQHPDRPQAARGGQAPAGDEVDTLLRDHFVRGLDARLGTARRRFLDALEHEAAQHPNDGHDAAAAAAGHHWRHDAGREVPVLRRHPWLAAGSLLAASLVLGITLSLNTLNGPSADPGMLAGDTGAVSNGTLGVAPGQRQPGFQNLSWDGGGEMWRDEVSRSRDAGLHVLEGRPVRAVHHVIVERTGFIDPDGFEVEIEIPHETYYLIDAPLQ